MDLQAWVAPPQTRTPRTPDRERSATSSVLFYIGASRSLPAFALPFLGGLGGLGRLVSTGLTSGLVSTTSGLVSGLMVSGFVSTSSGLVSGLVSGLASSFGVTAGFG